ncbi:MAG: APC family permease [Spirochaetaceae bacterium]|jgi:APA family basic amino acid/polyamine antiporter|nr:APC family permease [Spirochaetaceae bacterium]
MAQNLGTRDLERVLGAGSLFSVAIGSTIGAGVMSLMGVAIGMTGRSVVLSLFVAALITILQTVPRILIGGTVRLRGGAYTQGLMLGGVLYGGIYLFATVFQNLSLAVFALSFADYTAYFIPGIPRRLMAVVILTVFYLINVAGVSNMARVQRLIVVVIIASLILFAVFGLPKVRPGYFKEPGFYTDGFLGMLRAGALMLYAVYGAGNIINLSAQAKNPTRDIPLVCIVVTLFVALLYALMSVVASGVLPLDEVAGKPLTAVAEAVLPTPIFLFFMVGGALFALAANLNSLFATAPVSALQGSIDGWFPKKLSYISPRFKTPVVWLSIFYIIGLIPIFTGLDISDVMNLVLVVSQVLGIAGNFLIIRLPKVIPKEWAASKFHLSYPVLVIVAILSAGAGVFTGVVMIARSSLRLIVLNLIAIALILAFCLWRMKSGKVTTPEISYETE